MRILFIHKNFPAQFGALGLWLAANKGWDVTFATQREGVSHNKIRILRFTDHRETTKGIHHYVAGTERAVITGQGFVRLAVQMRRQGYVPDIVVAHSGWGPGIFAKDVWPETLYVPYVEWWYRAPAVDATPHDKQGDPLDQAARTRVRNAPSWLDFTSADAVIAPTEFQRSTFPDDLAAKITVLPDGMDTTLHSPGPRDPAMLAEYGVPEDAEILTYIARGMEPARGFPEMMGALQTLMKSRPRLHAFIVGEDRIAYGARDAGSWKERLLKELDLDTARLHFTGLVSRKRMVEILRAGNVHLYVSAPFVLSWSFLDAMASGALIVAHDTPPVREFMSHEKEGLLTDMYDPAALVAAIGRALDEGPALAPLRDAARAAMLSRMDAESVAYPAKVAFFEGLVAARRQGSPVSGS